jgi:hypothetical protein
MRHLAPGPNYAERIQVFSLPLCVFVLPFHSCINGFRDSFYGNKSSCIFSPPFHHFLHVVGFGRGGLALDVGLPGSLNFTQEQGGLLRSISRSIPCTGCEAQVP